MKIVISDYLDSMMPTHDYEKEILVNGLGQCEVVVYEYTDEKREEFFQIISDADAILTAFTKIDEEAMSHASHLKVISMNATGYDNVDLEVANKRGIGVCPVGEYSTVDVAEYTISIILALVKNLKAYIQDVDLNHKWRFDVVPPNKRIEDMILGIFGFGKIGQAVANLAKGLGMDVIACDPYISESVEEENGVRLVSQDEIFARADVITNNMNLNKSNYEFFNFENFKKMKQHPYFINMGRGASVVESDLLLALENNYVKGAGLDLLADETPDLANHPLVGLPNVILTPHAAFYSSTSIHELQRISTENIVHYLNGEKEKVFKLVSEN
ncbi:MAG: C-terminal binding protein [Lactobacillales bacterium]|jgi:D-3-phosphoglycerate dehydrogenase|nr:C-terminal binding protein [Lactobacillales bacterium]